MIRDASMTDISAIRALMNSVDGFWDASWRPDVLERAVGSPDTIALVHQDGAAVINGFICAHDLGFRAYLSELVVAPHVQRRGIGAQLLAEIERRVAERGCGEVLPIAGLDIALGDSCLQAAVMSRGPTRCCG